MVSPINLLFTIGRGFIWGSRPDSLRRLLPSSFSSSWHDVFKGEAGLIRVPEGSILRGSLADFIAMTRLVSAYHWDYYDALGVPLRPTIVAPGVNHIVIAILCGPCSASMRDGWVGPSTPAEATAGVGRRVVTVVN